MDKKIYLKTIEELNKDCIRSYNSKELQRYRLKKIIYDYLKKHTMLLVVIIFV